MNPHADRHAHTARAHAMLNAAMAKPSPSEAARLARIDRMLKGESGTGYTEAEDRKALDALSLDMNGGVPELHPPAVLLGPGGDYTRAWPAQGIPGNGGH